MNTTKSSQSYIKRLLAVLLSLALIAIVTVPLGGCDSEPSDEEGTTTAPPEDEPDPLRVGFIYSGEIANSSHNRMWEEARLSIETQLGVETYTIENVFVVNFREAVDMLVTGGINTIVSTSHFFVNAVEENARRHPNVAFVSYGGSVLSPNITTFRPLLFEAVHAAGLAAAHNVGEGVREIGVVVDRRMFNYKAVVNSFILGANEVRRVGFDIHVRYVDARSPAESRQALNEFRGMGIDTVFSYIDTEHAIRYAEQIGMSVVGYANNIAELAPTKHIAGFSFNANNYLAEQISMLYHDNFFPRGVIGGLGTGHVNMSELNTNRETVQYETIRLTNTLRDRVINGTVDIFADETMDNFGTVQIPNGAVLTASEILEMQWLEYSVGSNFEDITMPRADIPIVPLFIRRGAVAEAAWQEYLAAQSQGDSPQ